MTRRRDVLPQLPIVFGLGEIEAAAAVGVSTTTFRTMVDERKMPRPKKIGARKVYDVDELRAAFKSLPTEGEGEGTGWEDVA
jgi:hypothetical protein